MSDWKLPVPYEGEEPYLFISYSHQDKDLVYPVLEQLSRNGVRFWFDEGIDPGSEWPESIATHLAGSYACLAFISSRSLESKNCRREINYALNQEKEFLSVILEPVKMTPGIEMQISSYQSLLYYKYKDIDMVMSRLLKLSLLKPCIEEKPLRDPEISAEAPEKVTAEAASAGNAGNAENEGAAPVENTADAAAASGGAVQKTAVTEAEKKGREIKQNPREPGRKADRKGSSDRTENAGTGDAGTGNTGRKKGLLKKILFGVAAAAVILCAALYIIVAKPFVRSVKIGDKVYKDNLSGQTFRDAQIDAAAIKKLGKFKKCVSLQLIGCELPENTYEALSGMEELVALTLEECSIAGSTEPLNRLEKLRSLVISDCSLKDEDLAGFTGSSALEELDLSGNQLTELPSLLAQEDLKMLDVSQNSLTSLSDAASFKSIQVLRADQNQLTSFDGLEGLQTLTTLYLNGNSADSIGQLEGLIYLTELDIGNNPVTDLAPLKNCTVLEKLNIGNTSEMQDLGVVAQNSGTLTHLNLDGCDLTAGSDAESCLGKCTKLQALSVNSCKLKDLTLLPSESGLLWLSAASNEMESLEGIDKAGSLSFLNVSRNSLTSLEHFPDIQAAEVSEAVILLDHNELTDCSGLPSCDIRLLTLNGNEGLTDFSPLKGLSVKKLVLDVTDETELESLSETADRFCVTSVPLNRQVALEDILGTGSLEYIEEEEVLESISSEKTEFSFGIHASSNKFKVIEFSF